VKTLLEKCNTLSTDGLGYEAWLEKRKGSIGGSDAGSIMGLSAYGSPLTIYLEKKGLVSDREISRAAYRGKILEPVIFGLFAKDHPELAIEKAPYMFFSKTNPFMSANIDGLISGNATIDGKEISGTGILEIKTSKTGYGFGDDEIPDTHYAQVQHYLSVLDLPWAVISVYMLENEVIKNYVVMRNDDFIARLIAAEKDFWENFVQKDVMPAAMGLENEDDMITGMYEGSKAPVVLTNEEIDLCRTHKELGEQIDALRKQKDAVGINLKAKLGARTNGDGERKLSASGGGYSVSWSFYKRQSADSDALKKAGLFDLYCKTSECDRMTITKKKEVA